MNLDKIKSVIMTVWLQAVSMWREASEADKRDRIERRNRAAQEAMRQFRASLFGDYVNVGNAVKRWLDDEYSQLRLVRPATIEAVLRDNPADQIDRYPNGGIVFRYQASRAIQTLYLGGLQKAPPRTVPTQDIQKRATIELHKYMMAMGYDYCGAVVVTDIPGEKIQIEINGLYPIASGVNYYGY